MFVIVNEIRALPFTSVKGTLREDNVFVASGNSPGARRGQIPCEEVYRAGNQAGKWPSFLFTEARSYSTLSSAAGMTVIYAGLSLTDSSIAWLCPKTLFWCQPRLQY